MLMPLNVAGQTWVGTTGDYGTAGNWNPATVPSGGATATFTSTGANAVAIDGVHSAGAFVFDSGASAYTFTIGSGSALFLEGAGVTNNSGQIQTFTASTAGSNVSFFSNAEAGNAQFRFSGNSAVHFNGASKAGTATFDLVNGRLDASTSASLDRATITVSGSVGYVLLSHDAQGDRASLDLGADTHLHVQTSSATSMGAIAGTGTVQFGASSDVLLTVGSNGTSTAFDGVIDGGGVRGSIAKTGIGTWTLSGTNTYANGTTIEQGAISISRDANLGVASGGLTFRGGTLQTTATFSMSRATTLDTGGGTFDVATGTTLTLDGVIDGSGSLTKIGGGTLTLTADNSTFYNVVQINGGTLALAGSGGIPSGGIALDGTGAGTTFDISQVTDRTAVQQLNDTFTPGSPSTAVVRLGSKTLVITGLMDFNGTITDGGIGGGSGGGLDLDGSNVPTAVVTLRGVNTYTGATTIRANMLLQLQGAGSISQSRIVDLVDSGAIFNISEAAGPAVIKDLQGVAFTAVWLGDNSLTVGTENSTTFEGVIDAFTAAGHAGTGGLIKQGTGTLTLIGTNTYTGGTTINGGAIAVSRDENLGAATGFLTLNDGALRFNDSFNLAATRAITLATGGGTIDTNGFNTTIAQSIAGDGKLTKVGDGTLTLSGANTYLGGTLIGGGVLAVSSDANLGDAAGGLTFNGGTLRLLTSFDLAATRAVMLDVGGGTIDTGANDTTIAQNIGGAGGLTKLGAGRLTLAADNAYTGVTTVGEGTLALSGSGSIAASSGLDLSGAGATFDISVSSGNQTIQNLSGVGSALVVLGGNSLTVGSSNSTTFDGAIDGSGGLIKQASGTLTLGGANTYTGATTINAGTLALTNIGAIQDSAKVTVAAGAFLDLSGVTGYARVQTVDGGGTVQLGDSGLEITNGSTEFSGVIASTSGSGGLRIAGGIQTLSGVSTYTSLTTLQQGATLALKGTGSITSSSSIEFQAVTAGNATFDISQTTTGTSVSALNETRSSIGVVALGSKELVLTGTATDFLGTISDGGIGGGVGGRLTLAPGAQATLGGNNTYTGATTIGDGATLKLTGSGSIEQSSEVNLIAATAIGATTTFDISGLGFIGGIATIRNLAGNGTVQLGSSTLVVEQATGEFAGKIVDDDLGGSFMVFGGALTLTGQSTFTGLTMIGHGATLALKGTASIDKSAMIYFNDRGSLNATFDISQTTGGASVQALLDEGGLGVIELGSKTLTVTLGGIFLGVVKGEGGELTLGRGAELDLGGANTYTGATTVGENARLVLLDNGSIASSTGVRLIATGATLDISCSCGGEQTVQNLDGVVGSFVMLGDNNLRVISTVDTTFSGFILGNGGLVKEGAGTLTLAGNNTYGGGTTFKEGAIAVSGNGALGSESGALTFDGGALRLKAQFDLSDTRPITLNSGGGTIDTNGFNTTIAQGIDGDGGLTKVGGGTLVLSGINTYTGETMINAGTLALSNGDISSSSKVTVGTGATFDVSDNIGTLITALTGDGTVKLGSSSGLVIADASGEFSGAITSDLCGCSTLAIGGGTQTLSGTNTYTGITVLAAGATLALKGSGSIANSTGVEFVPFGPGVATFDISQTTAGAAVLGLADLDGVGVVSLGSKTLTVGANGGPFAGVIQDGGIGGGTGGGLSVASPGFGLQLAGVNTYTGATTIQADGLLAIVGPGSIAASSGVALAGSGAIFDISGDDDDQRQTIKDLSGVTGTTVALGGNSLTVGTANSTSFAGVIADGGYYGGIGGSLIKQGTGTLTLAGVNTYTGATTVNDGRLALAGAGSLASSSGVALTASGTAFDISGSGGNQTIRDLNGVAGTSIVLGSNSLTVGTANSTTFAGNISGTGGLTKQGTGNLTLTGSNSYAGGTTVSAGTLTGNSSSLQGAIVNNAAVVFDQAGAGTYGGNMSGTGSLTKTGAGDLTLSGTNSYGGGTTVSAGRLIGTTSSLQGNITNNAAVVFEQATSGTYAGILSGSGSLTKTGSGTVILANDNSYGGGTTINGGTLQLGNGGTSGSIAGNVVVNGADSLLAFNRSDTVTFAGDISGTGGIMLMGPGTVRLTGNNTFSGGTAIGGGIVQAASDAAFGAAGTTLRIGGGATVQALASFTSGRPITLIGMGGTFDTNGNTLTLQGAITGGGALTKVGAGTLILTGANGYTGGTTVEAGTVQGNTASLQGAIVNNASVVFDQSTDGTYAGAMSGTGSLTKTGAGNLTLSGANSYVGGTTVSGGTLTGSTTSLQGNIGAASTATVAFNQTANGAYNGVLSGGGALVKTGSGNLTLTGANTYSGGTTVAGGTLTGTTTSLQGNIVNNATVAFDQGINGTYAGNMSGSGGLVKNGAGMVILAGTNSYSGGTTVNGGVLQLGVGVSLAAGSALTVNGGTFDLNGNNQTVGALSGSGGAIALGSGTLTASSADNTTLASVISGSGSFVKQGSGMLTLTGASSYTGGTTVNEGTLQLGAGGALASGGVLTVNGGAFDLNGISQSVGALSGSGGLIALGGGTLTTNSASNTVLASAITGSGSFVKQGSGTLILTGVNSYAGGTTVSGGILQGNTAALQGSIVNNATVVFNQATNGTYAGAMSGNGALVKTGTGNLTLTGANSYTGGTTVSDGTLTGNTTSLQGNIVNNATVVFDQGVSDGAVLGYNAQLRSNSFLGSNANGTGSGAPPYIGAGTLTIGGANTYAGSALTDIYGRAMSSTQAITGAGTLILSGTNTYSGGTTVSSGTLTLTGSTVFATGTNGLLGLLSSIYAGAMSGSGALVKTGNGNLTLAGANSYTGGTTVSGGILIGTTSSLQGGIVNNATVAFDQGANGTYDGAMSGSGALLKSGAGNVTLTGANSYTGGTTVFQGILTGTTSSLQGNIVNNATVAFDQTANGTYAGAMSGTGSLVKTGAGALTLTGANSYAGTTTVNAGTLIGNSTSLQGNILNNAALVFDQASNGVYASALSGSGMLTKTGAGLLNLTGNSVVGGGTTVSAGTLAVNGSLTSNVTVGAGGAIGGTGTITGLLALNGGTLAPGNSIGTLNVTGNFSQAGGVYQVEANAGGQSDKIVATGTAAISGGTTVQVLAAQGTYQRSTTYTILSATGGLTGTYGGVTSNLAFLTPSLSYDANNAFLTLELLQNAFSFGGLTPNQRAVGRTLDTAFSGATGDFATVLNAMMGLSTTQGPAVLDTISGQPYASFGTVNVLANLLFMNTVGQQMALARTGGPGATRVALAEACEVACEMQEPPRWGAWFSGLGGAGNVGGNYNAGGLTYNLGGAAVGVDYRFDPRFLVGLAFGYSSGRQWVSGFQGLGTTDNYSAVLYASFTQGGFYADALAGYAYSDNRQQRVMQIPGLATRYANGGTGANQFLGQIEAGYKIGFGLTETAQASVTPFARFQTVAAAQKGFSEWGADSLNLTVQQQNTTSIRTVLGADLAADLPLGSDRSLGVTLRLGWAHDYGDTARPMTAAFAGAPTVPFTIVGAQPMRDSAVVGFGLSTKITDSISAYARYDGELNGRDDNHNFSAGFRMTW